MDGNNSRRIDRLEAALRAAHARREAPAPAEVPDMAASVLAAIKAAPSPSAPLAAEAGKRLGRLEDVLRAAHAGRPTPAADPGLADAVLASIKAGETGVLDVPPSRQERIDRLESVLRAAHAGRRTPPLDAGLAGSVVAAIQAEDTAPEAEEARVLWRMAAGAGFLAAATVLFALAFGSGLEDELGRLLFYDPSGQVVVSLLGV
ncbi:hypothetical protein [Solidesulfovibrio magneticus]|uniref:Uncharacterized protein n=1 Tax=Solidesulfovibrio magneticus (strain ATCC 700980 / DSM 13731 / RS-1) TaxID=573370 RepID=C4XQ22_SOLM1|nr:hypothetical protein [Solidesulfovibrio magneticus]BAH77721.1 hypothetical protein DMR_42300 [Solidesulfovibrio magneticus RS-1]